MTSLEFTIPGAARAQTARPAKSARNDSPILIDLSLPGTSAYWTTRWGVTLDALQQAVAAVGTNSVDVAAHLGLPKRRTAIAS